jgi:protein TonB
MKSKEIRTLDDLVFENRNKEYGSYYLRKKYHRWLVIGFSVAVGLVLILIFGYFWYLNKAGEASVYFGSAYPYQQETQVSLLSADELKAFAHEEMSQAPNPDQMKEINPIQSFVVTETPIKEPFKIPEEEIPNNPVESGSGFGMVNDSTVYGGMIGGDGEGMGNAVDHIPVFLGGDPKEYVEKNLRYPVAAMKKKISGVVIISFIVTKTGHVSDVRVVRSVNPIVDVEAVKTIQGMPMWKPALRHGRPINFIFTMRVNFVPLI